MTLTSATDGAAIYYTLDGSAPTQNSNKHESAIAITQAVTIKARAYASGHTMSDVMEAAYTIEG